MEKENNLPFIRPVPEEENPLVTRKKDVKEVFRLDVELGFQIHIATGEADGWRVGRTEVEFNTL